MKLEKIKRRKIGADFIKLPKVLVLTPNCTKSCSATIIGCTPLKFCESCKLLNWEKGKILHFLVSVGALFRLNVPLHWIKMSREILPAAPKTDVTQANQCKCCKTGQVTTFNLQLGLAIGWFPDLRQCH